MMKVFAVGAFLSLIWVSVESFSVESPSSASARTKAAVSSRASFLHNIVPITVSIGIVSTVLPSASFADITSQLASNSALRNLKSALKATTGQIRDLVDLNDYDGIKESLRVAPFSELRKSGSTLVKAAADDATTASMLESYKRMIASLEQFDSLASVAIRGRKLQDGQLNESFQAFSGAIEAFVQTAEQVAVPVSEGA